MIHIKINDTLYPATIDGKMTDYQWDNRSTKTITLTMGYADVVALLPAGMPWSIVQTDEVPTYDENGEQIFDGEGNPVMEEQTAEWDNSEYCLSGCVTDNRNGTVSIKMGKPTETETLRAQLAEIEEAYDEQ